MTAMKEQPSARQIYGTIGPACADVETLEAMFRAGMTGIRLNLSHVTLAQAADQVDALHKAAQRCGKQAELLIDMQGPELRVGVLAEPLTLNEGEVFELGGKGIPLPDIAIPALLPGQEVLLDDGKLLLRVTEQTETGAVAEVLRGGVLRGRKSLALPGADLEPPTMTASDVENIRIAAFCGVTGVMQPFVRSRRDLEIVRQALDENGGANIRLFAKIENQTGLERLPEFLETADEIVIARGDLGNAMPLWELPAAQKRIEAQCRKAGKPFMVVTQMLASMEQNPVPTRAEVSDIFNAVADGAVALAAVAGLGHHCGCCLPDGLGQHYVLLGDGTAEPVVHTGGIVGLAPEIGEGHAEGPCQLLLLLLRGRLAASLKLFDGQAGQSQRRRQRGTAEALFRPKCFDPLCHSYHDGMIPPYA